MVRVVVTGCCGRIGKGVVAELSGRGHVVTGIDVTAAPSSLRAHMASFVRGDLAQEGVADIVAGAEAVIHLAACPDDADFFSRLLEPNIMGVVRVLQACAAHDVPRVLVASSGKVMVGYNGQPVSKYPLNQGTDPAPRDLYCATKLFAEAATQAHAHASAGRSQCVCVRFAWCPRTTADASALEAVSEGGMGRDEYLSPADAGRCCACFVEAKLPSDFVYETVYCASRVTANGTPRFDLEPARRLFGFEPRDVYPDGISDIVQDCDYSPPIGLFPGTAAAAEKCGASSVGNSNNSIDGTKHEKGKEPVPE